MWAANRGPYNRPDGPETVQKTCHIQIYTADMPHERVKLSSIRLEDVAVDGPKIFLNRVFCMYPYDPPDGIRDEALIETPPPEDLTPYFNPADLELVVEPDAMLAVSKAFVRDNEAKWLARKLDLESPVMNHVSQMYSHNLHELVFQLLKCWQRVSGPKGTVRDLVTALCNSRNQAHCWILKDFLDKQRSGQLPKKEEDDKDEGKEGVSKKGEQQQKKK